MSVCYLAKPFPLTHVWLTDRQHFDWRGTCDCVLSLEVTLQKRSEGPMWPELVMGDRRGEYVMSDEQAALIHERLTHLTSEDLVRTQTLYSKAIRRKALMTKQTLLGNIGFFLCFVLTVVSSWPSTRFLLSPSLPPPPPPPAWPLTSVSPLQLLRGLFFLTSSTQHHTLVPRVAPSLTLGSISLPLPVSPSPSISVTQAHSRPSVLIKPFTC